MTHVLPYRDDPPEQARFALVITDRTPANQALYDALAALVDWIEAEEEWRAYEISRPAEQAQQAEQAQAETPAPARKRKRKRKRKPAQ